MVSRFFHRFGSIVLVVLVSWVGLAANAATLTGSFNPIASGSNVNLSVVGKVDWVHWGLHTVTSVDRKFTVTPRIGEIKAVGTSNSFLTLYQYADHANGYTWQDGFPTLAVTNTTTGIWAYGFPNLGSGVEFEVEADTSVRTLYVFVGVYKGRGTLSASLSDGSAPDFQDNSLFNSANGPGGVYVLNYSANSAGQTLRIRWILTQLAIGNPVDANVTIQAAAMTAPESNNPPVAVLIEPVSHEAFPEPASIQLTATAEDLDGSITNVAFYSGTIRLGESTNTPPLLIWDNVPRGRYTLTVQATDDRGTTSTSLPVDVFVYGGGGTQSGALAAAPPAVDLTLEGSGDWAHWGLLTNTSFNHKSAVPSQISNFTRLGTNRVHRYTNNYTVYSWTDGTPNATPGAQGATGVFISGIHDGFRITTPADTQSRQLRIYVGGYGMHAEFLAYLSDLSAQPYSDQSISNVYGSSYIVHTVDFAAASEGQELIVEYRSKNLFDLAYGNVTLQAATIQGAAPLAPPEIVDAFWSEDAFLLTFTTRAGRDYGVQYAGSPLSAVWTEFFTGPGNGSLVTVTNHNPPQGARYYRVQRK